MEIGGSSRAKGSMNEDAYLVDVGRLLFGVFDGVGATLQAAQAARLAAEAIEPPTTSAVRATTAHPSERSSPSLCGAPAC